MLPIPNSIVQRFNLTPDDVAEVEHLQRVMNRLSGNAQRAAQVLIMDSAFILAETVLAELTQPGEHK